MGKSIHFSCVLAWCSFVHTSGRGRLAQKSHALSAPFLSLDKVQISVRPQTMNLNRSRSNLGCCRKPRHSGESKRSNTSGLDNSVSFHRTRLCFLICRSSDLYHSDCTRTLKSEILAPAKILSNTNQELANSLIIEKCLHGCLD